MYCVIWVVLPTCRGSRKESRNREEKRRWRGDCIREVRGRIVDSECDELFRVWKGNDVKREKEMEML